MLWIFAGIDVSAKYLTIQLEKLPKQADTNPFDLAYNRQVETFEVPNTPAGHNKLIRALTPKGRRARVALEASGTYHLELALALHKTPGIELTVVNPRAARDFAKAGMNRSKTDKVDAAALLEFVRRMPFQLWKPPVVEAFQLNALGRRITTLIKARTGEKNRLHAAEQPSYELTAPVRNDIEVSIRFLKRRIDRLQDQAVALIRKHPWLHQRFAHLTSIKGVAEASAVLILSEICVLPKDMTPRQWVAHAGLDPRIFESGDSVHAATRISKLGNRYIRAALYMPALVACRHQPNIKAFYEKLIGREKAPLQAIVAVMRKLLHSIHGMFSSGTDFEGEKFYALTA